MHSAQNIDVSLKNKKNTPNC